MASRDRRDVTHLRVCTIVGARSAIAHTYRHTSRVFLLLLVFGWCTKPNTNPYIYTHSRSVWHMRDFGFLRRARARQVNSRERNDDAAQRAVKIKFGQISSTATGIGDGSAYSQSHLSRFAQRHAVPLKLSASRERQNPPIKYQTLGSEIVIVCSYVCSSCSWSFAWKFPDTLYYPWLRVWLRVVNDCANKLFNSHWTSQIIQNVDIKTAPVHKPKQFQ